MSAVTAIKSKVAKGSVLAQAKGLLSVLNLHWAGVGALALVNLYLLAQMRAITTPTRWPSSASR
jgi:hypothetical protein